MLHRPGGRIVEPKHLGRGNTKPTSLPGCRSSASSLGRGEVLFAAGRQRGTSPAARRAPASQPIWSRRTAAPSARRVQQAIDLSQARCAAAGDDAPIASFFDASMASLIRGLTRRSPRASGVDGARTTSASHAPGDQGTWAR
jgi:hypothetical protein